MKVEERLERHLDDYYGETKFTHKAKDWIIYYTIACESLEQARKIESHIKNMKSKVYIQNLQKHPEITERILKKYGAQD